MLISSIVKKPVSFEMVYTGVKHTFRATSMIEYILWATPIIILIAGLHLAHKKTGPTN
jgi:hypothetical protein